MAQEDDKKKGFEVASGVIKVDVPNERTMLTQGTQQEKTIDLDKITVRDFVWNLAKTVHRLVLMIAGESPGMAAEILSVMMGQAQGAMPDHILKANLPAIEKMVALAKVKAEQELAQMMKDGKMAGFPGMPLFQKKPGPGGNLPA